jgi:hypothetical protein
MTTFRLAALVAMAAIATTTTKAADLGYPAKVAKTTEPFSWTGCHIGAHAGAGLGHTKMRDPIPNGNIDATMTGQTANTDTAGGFSTETRYFFDPPCRFLVAQGGQKRSVAYSANSAILWFD